MDDQASQRTPPVEDVDDAAIESTMLRLLGERAVTSSICPSDVARAIGGDDWRDLMEDTRRVARRLVGDGRVQITQGGEVVDPFAVRGPIRIRWTRED